MTEAPTILVTGATRGIGRAITEAFATIPDLRLVFTYRKEEELARQLISSLAPCRAEALQLDLSSVDSIAAAVADLQQRLPRLDTLVNNAGLTEDGAFLMMGRESFSKVLDCNLKGTMRLTLGLMPLLLKSPRPTIVNMSSLAAVAGKEGQSAYSASKGAIIGFSRWLSSHYGPQGLVVNNIAPGFIRTDMVESLAPETYEHVVAGTSLRRIGEPDEIGALARFLATTSCRYLHSTTIRVDGGFLR